LGHLEEGLEFGDQLLREARKVAEELIKRDVCHAVFGGAAAGGCRVVWWCLASGMETERKV